MNSERIKAVLRLVVVVLFTWAALAKASGIDVFDVVEVLRYALTNPEVLVTNAIEAWVWWRNNNITDSAISAQNYLNMFKSGEPAVDYDDECEDADTVEILEVDVHE